MKIVCKATFLAILDVVCIPATFLSGIWLYHLKRALHKMPFSRFVLRRIGIIPIRHHYYEPLVFPSDLRKPLDEDRSIVGVELNVKEQLENLSKFNFNEELQELPLKSNKSGSFYYLNDWFGPGDAEFLFNMVRTHKPASIVEIGAGFSTMMIREAITKNLKQDPSYLCEHKCIEPNENPWLEDTGAQVIRAKAETLGTHYFGDLRENDLLFVDSSHVIRPQGDVLYVYLELLGSLNKGVIVHVHDIFTPKDYLDRWILTESKLFNEQYLLEAFLAFNTDFKVIGSLNHLWHQHRESLESVCPILKKNPNHEPSSFWLIKN